MSYDAAKPKLDDKFVDSKSYPVEACDYILENIDLSKARFYNEYNYGSYMLFRGIPVFYEDTFKKYNITHIITGKNSKTNMLITKTHDKNYKEIYSDDNFVIYERLSANE